VNGQNPKLGFNWSPIDDLLIRATWAPRSAPDIRKSTACRWHHGQNWVSRFDANYGRDQLYRRRTLPPVESALEVQSSAGSA